MSKLNLVANAEQTLILRLVGRVQTAPEEWRELARRVDWEQFRQIAGERLGPYIARRFRECGASSVIPETVQGGLDEMLRRACLAHVRRQAHLKHVLRILAAQGVTPIVLKGAALGLEVYPDPVLRAMADLDLWVADGQLNAVAEAMAAGGFPQPIRGDRTLRIGEYPLKVEIHAPPDSLRQLPVGWRVTAWERSKALTLGHQRFLVLHHEDLLVHLCLHASTGHLFHHGLRPFVDILLTLERWKGEWRWHEMARDYASCGILGWMYVTLRLTRDLLDTPLPQAILRELPQPPNIDEICALATHLVLHPAGSSLPDLARLLVSAPGRKARLGVLTRRLTSHYWRMDSLSPRGLASSVRNLLAMVWHDLTQKAPRYFRLWRAGYLRGDELKRRTELATIGARMTALVMRDRHAEKRPARSNEN